MDVTRACKHSRKNRLHLCIISKNYYRDTSRHKLIDKLTDDVNTSG